MFDEKDFDILVNTVNCVGISGKGVALECKKRYPEMFKQYVKDCQSSLYFPGYIKSHNLEDGKVIINVATKDHWRNPSQYPWIKDILGRLREYLKTEMFSKKVLIPALGCGNGGLHQYEVIPLIEKYLKDLEHDIIVFTY